MKVSLIAALSENRVIGKDQDLAWHLPDDMRFFKDKTMGRTVIMGRRNYESIPHKFRPLPGRPNMIISRNQNYEAPACSVFSSLREALEKAALEGEENAFVIGGGEIYRLALEQNLVDDMWLTHVHAHVEGDTFFPDFEEAEWTKSTLLSHPADASHPYDFSIVHYEKKQSN